MLFGLKVTIWDLHEFVVPGQTVTSPSSQTTSQDSNALQQFTQNGAINERKQAFRRFDVGTNNLSIRGTGGDVFNLYIALGKWQQFHFTTMAWHDLQKATQYRRFRARRNESGTAWGHGRKKFNQKLHEFIVSAGAMWFKKRRGKKQISTMPARLNAKAGTPPSPLL